MFELTVAGACAPALVDDCWSNLSQYRWRLDKHGYVMRKTMGKRIYLHHVVLPGTRYPSFVRDHVNRDKLDNRLSNLRWLALAQSNQNKGPQARNIVGIRGVTLVGGRYRAAARLGGKLHSLGYFDTAALAQFAVEQWRSTHMPYAA